MSFVIETLPCLVCKGAERYIDEHDSTKCKTPRWVSLRESNESACQYGKYVYSVYLQICRNITGSGSLNGMDNVWTGISHDVIIQYISIYLTRSWSEIEWSRVTQRYSRSVSSWFRFDLGIFEIWIDIWWYLIFGRFWDGMWGTSRIDYRVVKSCWQLVRRSQLKRVSLWLGRNAGRNHTGSVIIGDHQITRFSIDFLWGFPTRLTFFFWINIQSYSIML